MVIAIKEQLASEPLAQHRPEVRAGGRNVLGEFAEVIRPESEPQVKITGTLRYYPGSRLNSILTYAGIGLGVVVVLALALVRRRRAPEGVGPTA